MSLKNDEKKVIPVVKTGQKVQIGLPKLCNYDDDDDEEEEEQIAKPTLKNLNPIKTVENKKVTEKPRSGLLSMLPPPKSSQNPFLKKTPTPPNPTTFAPAVSKSSIGKDEETTTTKGTTSSGLLLPRHMMGSKFAVKIADQDSEPTSSVRPSPSSVLKSKAPIELPVTVKKTLVPEEDPDPFPEDRDDDDDDDDYEEKEDEVSSRNEAAVAAPGAQGAPVALDKDALLRLCGTQGGKKRKMEDIEFTEVSASAIVGDNQAELIKQVTSEYKPPSNKEYFTSSSKRTHHVTYLAKVALERDQELRDSWAQGKFNRKMAREKYGF